MKKSRENIEWSSLFWSEQFLHIYKVDIFQSNKHSQLIERNTGMNKMKLISSEYPMIGAFFERGGGG